MLSSHLWLLQFLDWSPKQKQKKKIQPNCSWQIIVYSWQTAVNVTLLHFLTALTSSYFSLSSNEDVSLSFTHIEAVPF